ncbi:calponin homology domain-containing protein [Blyttiomyces helicus]|uniref:Calponin homology domain-containing protein n=1 Tax=Blyttiomyces helicus TaxID=388810 RepID=A0A4P9WC41_9FUNG|nr:calponin homology domain-containing protein [Blyttiomyces helicus]|eukprot:RKO87906.1 calponin homology domain-containing protein [Blyttiomyces helicus]
MLPDLATPCKPNINTPRVAHGAARSFASFDPFPKPNSMSIPIYGLDRDLAEKAAAKFDPAREAEAREWIEACTGEKLSSANTQESLKDGVLLCKLINKVVPETNIKFNASKMPFKQVGGRGRGRRGSVVGE